MAPRIQARAIRRCGELLSEIESARGGDRGGGRPSTNGKPTEGRTPVGLTRTLERVVESQRARIATLPHGGDRRSDQAANLPVGPTQPEAAARVNVAERSVRSARAVERGQLAACSAATPRRGVLPRVGILRERAGEVQPGHRGVCDRARPFAVRGELANHRRATIVRLEQREALQPPSIDIAERRRRCRLHVLGLPGLAAIAQALIGGGR